MFISLCELRSLGAQMILAKTNSKRHDMGRWWMVYPLLFIQIAVVGWLDRHWQPSPDQWGLVMLSSISIVFPAAWIFARPTVFREAWVVGLVLQSVGVMVMSVGGVALSVGFSEPGRFMGVAFFASLLGLMWTGVFLLLISAYGLLSIAGTERGNRQHPNH